MDTLVVEDNILLSISNAVLATCVKYDVSKSKAWICGVGKDFTVVSTTNKYRF